MIPGRWRDTVTPRLRASDLSVSVIVQPLKRIACIPARRQPLQGYSGSPLEDRKPARPFPWMLGVVPREEHSAEGDRGGDIVEATREAGMVLQGLELRLGERVVIGHLGEAQ